MESVGAFGISTSLLKLLFVVFSWLDIVFEVYGDAVVANTVAFHGGRVGRGVGRLMHVQAALRDRQ